MMQRITHLIVLSRPRFWLYLAGPVLIGIAYGAESIAALVSLPALLLFGYFILPANLFLYGVNDIYDADIDQLNPKKYGRERRWSRDPVLTGVITISGILGIGTFLLTPPGAWVYLAGFFILAVGYSAPPLRFKTTPFLDSISNGLYILPGAAAYVTLAGTHPPLAILIGAWLWCMAMHTFSAIPDIHPDREAGIQTTATFLGHRQTLWYCLICWLVAASAVGAIDWRAGLVLGVYPLFVLGIAQLDIAVSRAYWWFPAINGIVGAVFTIGGLWRLTSVMDGFV